MNRDTAKTLFALMRGAICGDLLTEQEKNAYNESALTELLSAANNFDVANLLVVGLKENGLLSEKYKKLENELFKAVYRYERMEFELEQICDVLEKEKIPFIPLKGAVMRKYYPEPWMRTSCDIDVLIPSEKLQLAIDSLTKQLSYRFESKYTHDASLFSPSGIHLELHYDLVEQNRANRASRILAEVWADARLSEDCSYRYEMSDEMFYFYHIAHMAKHFENGGCGIRPFADVWVLNHRVPFSAEKREKLLKKGNLWLFAEQARLLSEVWFGNGEHSEITEQMQEYVLNGGIYGSAENRITVQQQKKGGKFKYVASKIFLPYRVLKYHYPILQKHRWLTPVMEIRRWGKLMFCGHAKRVMGMLEYNAGISDEKAEDMRRFLDNIGL